GSAPMALPSLASEVTDRQRNDAAVTAFAKRTGLPDQSFPASTVRDESRFSRLAESRNSVRVTDPVYFHSLPLGDEFEKCLFDTLAPLDQLQRPLGTAWISAEARTFFI